MGRTAVIAALVGLAAFAAGLVAGRTLGGGASPEIRQIVRTTTVVVVREQPNAPTTPPAAASNGDTAAPAPSPEDADLARRLLAEPAEAAPAAGAGTITGTVKLPDGTPLAGIEIAAVARRSWRRGWLDGEPLEDLETRARRFVADERRQDATRRTAVSGPDGRYALTSTGGVTYTLRTSLPDWTLVEVRGERAWKARTGDVIDFTAQARALVPLRVLLPDGSEPSEASIVFQQHGRSDSANWTREQRTARVAPGWARITAMSGESGEWKSDAVEADIPHHGATEIVLTLRERVGVTGRLLLAPGWESIRGFQVGIRREGATAAKWQHFAVEFGEPGSDVTSTGPSERNGFRYSLYDLPPGKWVLSVRVGGARDPAVEVPVEIGTSLLRLDVDVPPPDRSNFIDLVVLGPDGNPLTDATFILQRRSERGSWSRAAPAVRRPGGAWWVDATLDADAPADAAYSVLVETPEFGKAEAPFVPGPKATAQVRFEMPALVTATVAGYAGSGLEGMLTVALERVRTPAPLARAWGSVEADGRVKFKPTAPGEYDLVLFLGDGWNEGRPIRRTRFTLGAGDAVVSKLTIPEFFTLTVAAGDVGWKARFTARPADSTSQNVEATVDASGTAVLRRLTRGTWIVRMESGKREERRVEVTGDTTLRW